MALLGVESLDARYGLLQALSGVDLTVVEGETIALVGANGAGKTTLLRTIAGAHRPAAGRVRYDGADITGVPAYRRMRLGISLVPEGRHLFPGLTVEENLRLAQDRGRPGPWNLSTVLDAFPLLSPLRTKRAASLSGGEQQTTAIARALISNPRLLLLDEVSLGLAPVAVEAGYDSLRTLIGAGATIILVEQDLSRALHVSARVVCLLEGRIVLEGASTAFTRDQITEAFFGLRGSTGRRPR